MRQCTEEDRATGHFLPGELPCVLPCTHPDCGAQGAVHQSFTTNRITEWQPCVHTCRLVLKLGPQYDMGALLPRASEGWQMAMHGSQWAVWIKA